MAKMPSYFLAVKGRLCPSTPPVDHRCVFWHLPLLFSLFASVAFHSFSSNFRLIVWVFVSFALSPCYLCWFLSLVFFVLSCSILLFYQLKAFRSIPFCLQHTSDDLKHFTVDNQLETASNGKFSQGTHVSGVCPMPMENAFWNSIKGNFGLHDYKMYI
ncbi:hypothetical protein DVH24_008633 [Malus domestica]|uniref:Uncharacterized protein n=1 Tax=Malus domestica TaxID=3750 RepID=A0A498JQI7_MALDO|nr:hypothetical protein DVH24_008633 [Malus domestica]